VKFQSIFTKLCFHKSPRQYQQKPESYAQNAVLDNFPRAKPTLFLQTLYTTNIPKNPNLTPAKQVQTIPDMPI
jgi:hypothetical protein